MAGSKIELPNEKGENSLIGGFVRDANQHNAKYPLIVETTRPDELSRPDKDAAAQRLAVSSAGKGHRRGFHAGPNPRGGGKYKLTVLGVSKDVVEKADPKWKNNLKNANAYRKARARELYITHGYVSAGVSALLATSALALAASRYLYEKMSESGDISYLKQASSLADSSRQNEMAAYELCHREAVAKGRSDAASSGVPWMKTKDEGQAKRGPKPQAAISVPAVVSSGDEQKS